MTAAAIILGALLAVLLIPAIRGHRFWTSDARRRRLFAAQQDGTAELAAIERGIERAAATALRRGRP